MSDGTMMQRLRFGRVLLLACATAFLGLVLPVTGAQAPECLIEVFEQGKSSAIGNGSTVCAVAPAGSKFCTIDLQLCHNVGSCSAGPLKGKARTTGNCNPGKLTVSSTGSSSCGAFTGIKVRTKKNGKKMGQCRIRVQAHAKGQSAVDKVNLVCMPTGSACASPSGAFLDPLDTP